MGIFNKKSKKAKQVTAKDSLKEMKQATARFEFSQANKPKNQNEQEAKRVFNYQSEKPNVFRTTQDRVWDFLFTEKRRS